MHGCRGLHLNGADDSLVSIVTSLSQVKGIRFRIELVLQIGLHLLLDARGVLLLRGTRARDRGRRGLFCLLRGQGRNSDKSKILC